MASRTEAGMSFATLYVTEGIKSFVNGLDGRGRVAMNVPTFLEEQKCCFERIRHEPTYSAQRLAEELHVPGREVAKTVLLRANAQGGHMFIVAVLPASKQIDFKQAAKYLAANKVRLATEIEIAEHCPDCDFGVLPPFGSRYGMRTIVDPSLTADEEIWFEGNTYREAIRMRFEDFRRVERPRVFPFAMSA
jgi:Ala-tRNA(Pro) deacylase